ncbi:MAG: PQQ-binding-like beta-propeller repeat protein [Ginsengibacter sp.]
MAKSHSSFVLSASYFIVIGIFFLTVPQTGFCQTSTQNRNATNSNSLNDFKVAPQLKWKFHTSQPLMASPVINQGVVYFGGLDSMLYAIDINTGKVNWKFRTQGEIRSDVLINDTLLYLVGGDGTFYSIDKNSGKLKWRWTFNSTASFLGERRYDIADYFNSSPVLYKNTVYFGSADGRVNAINADNGKLLWTFKSDDIVHTTPAVYNDKLFFGSFDGNVYALNSNNGSLLWKFKTMGHEFFPKGELQGSPVVWNDVVYIGARDYNLYAININGGYCNWNQKFPKGWALANTVRDSVLYIGTSDDRYIASADAATGKEKWRTNVKFNIFGPCAFSKSMLYVGTLTGEVYALELKTGAIQWTFTTDGYKANHNKYFKADNAFSDDFYNIIKSNVDYINAQLKWGAVFSSPAISNDVIVITSTDGSVYCLTHT